MTKPCYEEYAKHAFRFYARHPALKIKGSGLSRSEVENWQACDDVFGMLNDQEREIVISVFRSREYIVDTVRGLSKKMHISENYIWELLSSTTKKFAERRELK